MRTLICPLKAANSNVRTLPLCLPSRGQSHCTSLAGCSRSVPALACVVRAHVRTGQPGREASIALCLVDGRGRPARLTRAAGHSKPQPGPGRQAQWAKQHGTAPDGVRMVACLAKLRWRPGKRRLSQRAPMPVRDTSHKGWHSSCSCPPAAEMLVREWMTSGSAASHLGRFPSGRRHRSVTPIT